MLGDKPIELKHLSDLVYVKYAIYEGMSTGPCHSYLYTVVLSNLNSASVHGTNCLEWQACKETY